MVVVKGEPSDIAPIGEPIVKIKEVDNPKLVSEIQELTDLLEFKDDKIKTLNDELANALNAEAAAKKEAEDLKKQLPKLKASVAKLKKALSEE